MSDQAITIHGAAAHIAQIAKSSPVEFAKMYRANVVHDMLWQIARLAERVGDEVHAESEILGTDNSNIAGRRISHYIVAIADEIKRGDAEQGP